MGLTNFIDSLFSPVTQFLDLATAKLSSLGSVAAKGVHLNDYFGFFGILGGAWTAVISSLLGALLFLFTLYNIQKLSRVLLWLKDLIKWW
jgi:hypothetical protein